MAKSTLTVLFLKLLPGQEPAIAEYYKTGAGAKTIKARIKSKRTRTLLTGDKHIGDKGARTSA